MHLYLITNTMTGTQYVGKTIRPLPARWKEHLYRAHRGSESHLHRAIHKYGADAFKIQAFPFEPQDERSLNEWEKFLIGALRCAGKLYNRHRRRGWSIRTSTHRRTLQANKPRSSWILPRTCHSKSRANAESRKDSWSDPMFGKRQAARNHEQLARMRQDPEFEKNRIDRLKKKMNSPEHSKKNAEHARRICHCALARQTRNYEIILGYL